MSVSFPDTGQVISIGAQVLLMCYLLSQMNKMPFGFWHITVNRIRYIRLIGIRNWLSQFLPYKASTLEYSPYNESYLWLKGTPVYYGYLLMFWTSFGLVCGLIHQYGLGQVYTKPKEFFVSSPLRQYSIYFVISCLVAENIALKKENGMLTQLHYRMKDQIKDLKTKIAAYL